MSTSYGKTWSHVLIILLFGVALGGSTQGAICSGNHRPGATLLIPYFEVDIENPDGHDTLFSIGNTDSIPALAHVVLWTDLGVSTLAFDVYLDGYGVSSFSLRRILLQEQLPSTGDEQTRSWFPSCVSPLRVPALDAADHAALRAQHTGRPDPASGLCSGLPREDTLAVGYVTVDLIRDCSDTVRFPHDPGYFARAGDPGIVSDRNVLWGDMILMDPAADSAQGLAAVAFPADDRNLRTFWEDFSGGTDHRGGLGERYRARYLDGGPFNGGTDVVIWTRNTFGAGFPRPCDGSRTESHLSYRFTNESGSVSDEQHEELPAQVVRRKIGVDVPAPSPFGFVEISGSRSNPIGVVPLPMPLLTFPLMSAENRFSVALATTELEGACTDLTDSPADGRGGANLGYASDTVFGRHLFEVDVDHGTFRRLPNLGGEVPFHDMTVGPDGRLYGFFSAGIISTNYLRIIDPLTGEFFQPEEDLPSGARSIVFDPSGDLWVLGRTQLHRIDPTTAVSMQVVPFDQGISGLTASADQVYGWRHDAGSRRYDFFEIDVTSGGLSSAFSIELDGGELDGGELVAADFDRRGDLRWVRRVETSAVGIEKQSFHRVPREHLDQAVPPALLTAEDLVVFPLDDPYIVSMAMRKTAPEPRRSGSATPAASLLVPYFEVDVAKAGGRNTLFSLNNAAQHPVLAHVVLWTDWGIPTLDFDLFLGAGAGRMVDLRRIFVGIAVPGPGSIDVQTFPGCDGVSPPSLDDADLVAKHTGRPHAADGLCYSSPAGLPSLVTGHVTIDGIRDCSETVHTPRDEGYFGDEGLAADENVLWGEVFLIDNAQDFAQGFSSVPVPATAGPEPLTSSFYGVSDNREPIGCASRIRYFESGVFDGGTDLLVWSSRSPVKGEPRACSSPSCLIRLQATSRAEAGGSAQSTELDVDRQSLRVEVGDILPTSTPFGSLDLTASRVDLCEQTDYSLPKRENVQLWALPLMSARGRFSVALDAAELPGVCR